MTAMSHSIGYYEFRDPDYRQLLLWAGELKLDPVVAVRLGIHAGKADRNFWTHKPYRTTNSRSQGTGTFLPKP